MFPTASRIIGIDLSPYMLVIGKFLLEEISEKKERENEKDENINVNNVSNSDSINDASNDNIKNNKNNKTNKNNGNNQDRKSSGEIKRIEWVDKIEEDNRIEFQYGDMADTGLQSGQILLFLSVTVFFSVFVLCFHFLFSFFCS